MIKYIFIVLVISFLTVKFHYPVSLYLGIFPDIEKRMICYNKDNDIIFDDVILAPVEPRENNLYVRLKGGDRKTFVQIPNFSYCKFDREPQ